MGRFKIQFFRNDRFRILFLPNDKNDLKIFLANHPGIVIFSIAFLFALVVVILTLLSGFYDKDFLKNILVELHGLAFDLLILYSIILFVTKFHERQQTIQRYREEIEDYRFWKADEAKFRIVGNIKRLNRLGVTDINLERAYLVDAYLGKTNLKRANLEYADLKGAKLVDIHLEEANLTGAHLEGSVLLNTHLEGAILYRTNLKGAHLGITYKEGVDGKSIHLEGAVLLNANLEGADLTGIIHDDKTIWEKITYNDKTKWPNRRRVNLPESALNTSTRVKANISSESRKTEKLNLIRKTKHPKISAKK